VIIGLSVGVFSAVAVVSIGRDHVIGKEHVWKH